MYYITSGVPSSILPPLPRYQMMNIMHLLPPGPENSDEHIQIMREIEAEVERDYYFSLKKSIGIRQYKINCPCCFNGCIVVLRPHRHMPVSPLN